MTMMFDQSQTCPSCRSSKYSNPQLKLMVNTCGHPLCENCVEVLFVRGSGLCLQCKIPLRKANFRCQLFEDPLVQKEVEIRKKILSDFNKREDDFKSMEDYDLYLEKIEEIIYNLVNDIDVEETKRYIEAYKRENKDIIKKNRLKQSSSIAFYEAELEREKMLREQLEKEDEELRNQLFKASSLGSGVNSTPPDSRGHRDLLRTPPPSSGYIDDINTVRSVTKPPPSTIKPVPPSTPQFFSPASSLPTRMRPDYVYIPPPPSAVRGGSLAPPSLLPAPASSVGVNWGIHSHHQVSMPLRIPQQPRQPDTVLIPTHTKASSSSNRVDNEQGAFVHKPYQFDLSGPPFPSTDHVRWPEIVQVYNDAIVRPLCLSQSTVKKTAESPTRLDVKKTDERDLSDCKPLRSFRHKSRLKMESMEVDEAQLKVEPVESERNSVPTAPSSLNSLHGLPAGACGLAPVVFLQRCLQESRCGLFL